MLLAPQGTADYVALTAALAPLAGLISVLAGLLRLGRIASFFSTSVLLGFVFGLALIISMKQVPKILGQDVSDQNFFLLLGKVVRNLGDTSLSTLAVGVACMAGIDPAGAIPAQTARCADRPRRVHRSLRMARPGHAWRRGRRRPPIRTRVAETASRGPRIGALAVRRCGRHRPIGVRRSDGTSTTLAKEHGYEVDANRELVAVGAANMGAGLFQGFPIGASLSKSAANRPSGIGAATAPWTNPRTFG